MKPIYGSNMTTEQKVERVTAETDDVNTFTNTHIVSLGNLDKNKFDWVFIQCPSSLISIYIFGV